MNKLNPENAKLFGKGKAVNKAKLKQESKSFFGFSYSKPANEEMKVPTDPCYVSVKESGDTFSCLYFFFFFL